MQVPEHIGAAISGAGDAAGGAAVPGGPDLGPAQVERLAAFVHRAPYGDTSEEACQALEVRLIDSIACDTGALDGAPIYMLRAHLRSIGGSPLSTLSGSGDKVAPEGAAIYDCAQMRYLDCNHSYFSTGETCHPTYVHESSEAKL